MLEGHRDLHRSNVNRRKKTQDCIGTGWQAKQLFIQRNRESSIDSDDRQPQRLGESAAINFAVSDREEEAKSQKEDDRTELKIVECVC